MPLQSRGDASSSSWVDGGGMTTMTRQESMDAAGAAFAKALRNLDRRRAEEAAKGQISASVVVR